MVKQMQTKRIEKSKFSSKGSGRNPQGMPIEASSITVTKDNSNLDQTQLIEKVIERSNLIRALQRVERNKGAAGIDKMQTGELRIYLKTAWSKIKEQLLDGSYQPKPVRRIEIPKPGSSGMRKLGIPTVVARFIQQALNQVLSEVFEEQFSDSSYGFRPNRSTHQAVKAAKMQVESGKRWVVDMDLEKFFDRVNHDILMSRIARKVNDKRVLLLIRKYLQAGHLENGVVIIGDEGTPQGGPLSPLLSNILLDDLDKELEQRGLAFVRYADDCNIYVKSKRAGDRVLLSITEFLKRKLKLTVNQEKSAVARPWDRKFLGYSMTNHLKPRLKVAKASVMKLQVKLKEYFRKGRGRNLKWFTNEDLNPVLRGWGNYFKLAEVVITFEELDGWIRRKCRRLLWKQWKKPRTRTSNLRKRGLKEDRALKSTMNGRGAWWNSGASHMNEAYPKKYFDQIGLISLLDLLRANQRAT
jgi:RNA-directed DNA polymerase